MKNDGGCYTFKVKGDVHYHLPELNQKRIILLDKLKHIHNDCQLNAEDIKSYCLFYIGEIKYESELCQKSIESLKKKYRVNSVSLSREMGRNAMLKEASSQFQEILEQMNFQEEYLIQR